MTDSRLPNLFKPIEIKGLRLNNRLVMAPMLTRMATYSGKATERLSAFYAERARGGVGLIIMQFTAVSREGRHGLYTPALWSDDFIPGFERLADQVHAAGGKVAVQLAHAGGNARSAFLGTRPVAPSPIAVKGGEMPRELSIGEIERLVESFAQAAGRAREAGLDAVEFHAAHGYLGNQFISPLWNRREDRYGGSTENRTRFLLEIVQRTRELVGDAYPILVRLCGDEQVTGGVTLDESRRVARLLESAGVDALDISAGIVSETTARFMSPSLLPPGLLVHLAAGVRQVVGVPVVAVGRLHQPDLAESVLAEGKADLIALGRALFADPYWPAKAAEGRWDEIRPCLACGAPDCNGRVNRQMELGCVVNPTVAREEMFRLTPARQPKRVMVVGGGPAGMEAAMAASQRGHQVALFERNQQLGGQLPLAAAPPNKDEMGRYISYLRGAVARSAVRVATGAEVDEALVEAERPDVVIVAAGSKPVILPVPVREQQTATAWEVLAGTVEVGQSVVIVGGGDVGCETAQFLAARGRLVTILEMLPDVATELTWWSHDLMVEQLVSADVDILTNSRLVSAVQGTVTYDRAGITNQILGVDTLVFAVGVKPETSLGARLAEKGFDVRMVGDCARTGNIGTAVRSGFEAGFGVD